MSNRRKRIVAVTGGIGSGKSVVCRILSALGHEVYDCDSQAKRLMDTSVDIKMALCREIHPDAVVDGCIDRKLLSGIVFSNQDKLRTLNAIVHAAVREDIVRWASAYSLNGPIFVETAILYQSGLDQLVDEVWEVQAPEALRVERVMARNALTEAEVRARIRSQDFESVRFHPNVKVIINDGRASLLLQMHALLG